jgi:hypothetical protein
MQGGEIKLEKGQEKIHTESPDVTILVRSMGREHTWWSYGDSEEIAGKSTG